ncbi:preprotein translocase subunit SecG [candidate division WOR-3 bacterium]|uniref:Protein-export membrane protein SecG n=1 Tax=candidate division WOR-3 bacterium TaxID=2052148 RepID=A0A9D5QD49_UNCW3|nr:preprotein translocase subunit SecG [candidate division WOR-3 bacterium]MBD3364737.1 preprotein translocase subunit SecG [candidate division WOR-3 bacterium]
MLIKPWVIAVGILFILLCILLAIIVLLQQRGKGGMAGVFGGGGGGGAGAEQIFGSSGVAPFMTKITAILGAVFMAFALILILVVAPPRRLGGTGAAGGEHPGPPIPGQFAAQTEETPATEATEPAETTATEEAPSDVRSLLFDTTSTGGE